MVTEIGGADAVDLFTGIVLVFKLANTEGDGVAFQVVAVAGAGDGIQAQFVGLAVGVLTLGNDADALALDVLQLGVTTGEIKGDVLNATDRTVLKQGIVLGDRPHERGFGLVGVDRNVGVGLFLRGA